MARVAYLKSEEDGYEALVILDEQSGDSLEVQRKLAEREEENSEGDESHCLVRAGGPVAYDAVRGWTVDADQLVLVLTDVAAATLELPLETHISLEDDHAVQLVLATLGQILDMPAGSS